MATELDQSSRKPEEEQLLEPKNLRIEIETNQVGLNLKQLKSLEILKSAVDILTSKTKLLLLIFLSIIPLFSFMVFFDIKLHKLVLFPPRLRYSSPVILVLARGSNQTYSSTDYVKFSDDDNNQFDSFSESLQVSLLWFVLYPLLETFSMVITIRIAAKIHAGDKNANLKEILCQNSNLKGLSVTCFCVHLLSNLNLIGLFWIVTNNFILTNNLDLSLHFYFYNPVGLSLFILSTAMHTVLFVALLYKYLDWSAFWNMGIVISVLGEETGTLAFGLSDYYGKHCKKTGFQLMFVVFASGNFLRMLCLFKGLCNAGVGGVVVAAIGIGLLCLANIIKWVAFVVYFYDCKQQTLGKKADEEVGKHKNLNV